MLKNMIEMDIKLRVWLIVHLNDDNVSDGLYIFVRDMLSEIQLVDIPQLKTLLIKAEYKKQEVRSLWQDIQYMNI